MSLKRTHIVSPESSHLEKLLSQTTELRQRERLLAARMACTGQYTLAMIAEATGG